MDESNIRKCGRCSAKYNIRFRHVCDDTRDHIYKGGSDAKD